MQRVLTFASSLTKLTEVNSSFDSGVLRIAYHGKNRNGSYIDKQTFERCMNTIYNCPIVCHYDIETDTIGGHDIDLIKDDSGDLRVVNLTTPVGCIPESARVFWDKIEEDNGDINEYLCVDALIWKRQSAYKKLKENGCTEQSMEINIKDGEMVDGIYVIRDFEFTAFTLLGIEPCFESASLEFANEDFKSQMKKMMTELKESFLNIAPTLEDNDIHTHDFSMEGGSANMENNLTNETADAQLDTVNNNAGKNDVTENPENKADFQLENIFRTELSRAVEELDKITYCNAEYPRYHVDDYDKELNEVYVWDADDWMLYGMSYATEGDVVIVDKESKKRKKYVIADFEDGDAQTSPFAEVFSTVREYASDKAEYVENYEKAKSEINSLEAKVEDLEQFKNDVEARDMANKKNDIIERFIDLQGIEEFELLKSNLTNTDLSSIEEKCFAIRGKNVKPLNAGTNTPGNAKIHIEKESKFSSYREPYGGVVEKYSK